MRLSIALLAAALLGVAGVAAGAEPAATQRIIGTILGVHHAQNEVVVNGRTGTGKAEEIHLQVTDETHIVFGTHERPLSVLKMGQSVTVTYTTKGGVHQAQTISVEPPPVSAPRSPGLPGRPGP